MAGEAFKKTRGEKTPEAMAYHDGMIEGEALGRKTGAAEERSRILELLERMYMQPQVKRGTVPAEAILQVTRQLALDFQAHPLVEKKEG